MALDRQQFRTGVRARTAPGQLGERGVHLGSLGPEGYSGLWTGKTEWNGPGVKKALETMVRVLGYVNADHWALAVPIARTHSIIGSMVVTRNAYPREALVETILRFIEEDLSAPRERGLLD